MIKEGSWGSFVCGGALVVVVRFPGKYGIVR